jgi:hypothetical protein
MPDTVGDDFPRQQERVRKLAQFGREIGPAGTFYVAVCEAALKKADEAAIGGDLVEILAAYQQMKDIKE